jgi:hypothetical protein
LSSAENEGFGALHAATIDDQLARLRVEQAGVVDSELACGQARQPAVDRAGAEVQAEWVNEVQAEWVKDVGADFDRLELHEAELDHDG